MSRREAEEEQRKYEMKRTDAKTFAAKPSAKRQDEREEDEGFHEYEYVNWEEWIHWRVTTCLTSTQSQFLKDHLLEDNITCVWGEVVVFVRVSIFQLSTISQIP